MIVTTWTLEMLRPPASGPRALPGGLRLDRAAAMTPEYARFLYGLVGGAWRWTERLAWSREQWSEELSVPGAEFWIAYGEGVPLGYVHLHPQSVDDRTHVEIRYFGLVEQAIGRGVGGPLLEQGISAAWSLPDRHDLPAVSRVWVHTCSLDGPAALANYQARGLAIRSVEDQDEETLDEPLGAWISTGGPVSAA